MAGIPKRSIGGGVMVFLWKLKMLWFYTLSAWRSWREEIWMTHPEDPYCCSGRQSHSQAGNQSSIGDPAPKPKTRIPGIAPPVVPWDDPAVQDLRRKVCPICLGQGGVCNSCGKPWDRFDIECETNQRKPLSGSFSCYGSWKRCRHCVQREREGETS